MQLKKQARLRTRRNMPPELKAWVRSLNTWKNTVGQMWKDGELVKGKLSDQQKGNYV